MKKVRKVRWHGGVRETLKAHWSFFVSAFELTPFALVLENWECMETELWEG